MGIKKWIVSQHDKELAKELSVECGIDPIVALIASARGYTDATELEQFISDEPYFSDPWQMADIEKAALVIDKAIENKEKIAIYGDYDCDGVVATTLFYNYIKSRECDCVYYIPDRFEEGYGMNVSAIEKLAKERIGLIITVDNGIVSFDEIEYANKLGIKVVVTDHHLPQEQLPKALAVVDPHRKDCPSEFKTICGAQVAFRLICVIEGKEPEELLPLYADLLSIAVIADVMPLTAENRSIVKYGVNKIRNSGITGISALLSVAGIDRDTVNATKIAYGLCPRINAAGRMGSAARAVELLSCENMMQALNIATEINSDNTERQSIEKNIFEQAVLQIESNGYMYDRVIVASAQGWHHGVVGIVASRIAEKYGCPTVLLSVDGEEASGSGRSIEGFSLYNAISFCKDLTLKFGGHEQAAGITLKTEDIDNFRKRINEYALSSQPVVPTLKLDCKLNPSALSLDLAFALEAIEPYGAGNKPPLFGVFAVTLQRITPIANNKHLRLLFSKDLNSFQALLFGVTPESFCFCEGDVLDLAVTVEPNSYRGEYSVSVQIKAIRMSGTNDDKVFEELFAFNDFYAGRPFDSEAILPSREDVGVIYKKICEKPVTEERLKYLYMNQIGYAKTIVAVKTLTELGLIAKDKENYYSAVKGAAKTSLINSQTYKKITEGSGNIE